MTLVFVGCCSLIHATLTYQAQLYCRHDASKQVILSSPASSDVQESKRRSVSSKQMLKCLVKVLQASKWPRHLEWARTVSTSKFWGLRNQAICTQSSSVVLTSKLWCLHNQSKVEVAWTNKNRVSANKHMSKYRFKQVLVSILTSIVVQQTRSVFKRLNVIFTLLCLPIPCFLIGQMKLLENCLVKHCIKHYRLLSFY